jgi:hypothetical protein
MRKFAIGLLTLAMYAASLPVIAMITRSRASVWPAVRSGRSDLPGKRPRHRLPGVSSSNRGRSRSKKRDLIFPFWSPPSPNLQHGPCRRV